jgi:hypothetical protein
MRYESSVTSLSWIPSEAVTGTTRAVFEAGFTHYDQPPPAQVGDLDELRAADRFRFANQLSAWIEVDDSGRVTGGDYASGGLMGATTVRLGGLSRTFQAVALPDLQRPPRECVSDDGRPGLRFVQTTGGRTALPAPRPVRRPPFVRWQAPLVWTTLSLTLYAGGACEYAVEGASRFPRHWIYDTKGRLSHKSGLTDYSDWAQVSFGRHTPWGDEDSPALVTAVETALERALSVQLMHGAAAPRIQRLTAGSELVRQGEAGDLVFLILDGVIRVEKDGEELAEYGPGAMLGERAPLEGGTRTSTLVAVTPCRIASVSAANLDLNALTELATGHRREDAVRG